MKSPLLAKEYEQLNKRTRALEQLCMEVQAYTKATGSPPPLPCRDGSTDAYKKIDEIHNDLIFVEKTLEQVADTIANQSGNTLRICVGIDYITPHILALSHTEHNLYQLVHRLSTHQDNHIGNYNQITDTLNAYINQWSDDKYRPLWTAAGTKYDLTITHPESDPAMLSSQKCAY